MRPFARLVGALTLSAALTAAAVSALPATAGAADAVDALAAQPETGRQFSVLGRPGVPVAEILAVVTAAGGSVEAANAVIGLVTARAAGEGFSERVARSSVVQVVAPVRVLGRVPDLLPGVLPGGAPELLTPGRDRARTGARAVAKPTRAGAASVRPSGPTTTDPLDTNLWGLSAIGADRARATEPGDRRVLVGVLDTGVDGTHPDIAPNFNRKLSRNFVTDLPTDPLGQQLDGPCEAVDCKDPADADDNGHGTHVAGTIAAAADGFGISGVAPNVQIVNVRGALDSGLFFLQAVTDAITYSADVGIDVLNMSFYVDPWAANCASNPADTPQQQAEQQVILEGMTRAMAYADSKGVTQVVALGNSSMDPQSPHIDASSPNYPSNTAHPRVVDSSCKDLPAADPHAIRVGAYGPSGGKAGYSNYGPSLSVTAPGGWFDDYAGTADGSAYENGILSAYPTDLAVSQGDVDPTGGVTAQGQAGKVLQACKGNACGYYHFYQGTSMATPHAAGVVALIVSAYGAGKGARFTLAPARVRTVLEGTARGVACPDPLLALATYQALCAGDTTFNTFYGHGSVDALAAVTQGAQLLAADRP